MNSDQKKHSIEEKLSDARSRLSEAEDLFQQLVADIQVTARANKTTISAAVESALDNLHAARVELEKLEDLVTTHDPQ